MTGASPTARTPSANVGEVASASADGDSVKVRAASVVRALSNVQTAAWSSRVSTFDGWSILLPGYIAQRK